MLLSYWQDLWLIIDVIFFLHGFAWQKPLSFIFIYCLYYNMPVLWCWPGGSDHKLQSPHPPPSKSFVLVSLTCSDSSMHIPRAVHPHPKNKTLGPIQLFPLTWQQQISTTGPLPPCCCAPPVSRHRWRCPWGLTWMGSPACPHHLHLQTDMHLVTPWQVWRQAPNMRAIASGPFPCFQAMSQWFLIYREENTTTAQISKPAVNQCCRVWIL